MQSEFRRLFTLKSNSKPAILLFRENKPPVTERQSLRPDVQLPAETLQLLHWLRRELNDGLVPDEGASPGEILGFALKELLSALTSSSREDEMLRFLFYLSERRRES